MANLTRWSVASYTGTNILSTNEIQTLANNVLSCRSSLIPNASSCANIYGMFELTTWIGTGACAPYATLYALPAPDLSNGPSTQDEEAIVLGTFPMSTATSTTASAMKRMSLVNVTLPPTDFAVALKNNTGQSFSTALGNSVLKYWKYDVTGNA